MVTQDRLSHYEPLIRVHAARVAERVDDDFEDIVQGYRIKAWRALLSFDPTKWTRPAARDEAERRYVFMCLKNAEKDVLKKRRRPESFIEDIAPATSTSDGGSFRSQSRDSFDARHGLVVDHEHVYGAVDEDRVLLPNTLERLEVHVVCLLYRDYSQAEAARTLGIEKRAMERVMRSIRSKMEDWRPTPATSCTALVQVLSGGRRPEIVLPTAVAA